MRLNLRARTILLMAAASLIPLTLAGIAAAVRIEANLVRDILAGQRRLIAEIRLDVESEFGWYKRQLETLSMQLPVQSMRPQASRAALTAMVPRVSSGPANERRASSVHLGFGWPRDGARRRATRAENVSTLTKARLDEGQGSSADHRSYSAI